MNQNPLLKKLSNNKYNPDIVQRYENMKNERGTQLNIPRQRSKFDEVQDKSPTMNVDTITKARMTQDSSFSQIFSKENFVRNKLVFENRQQEVSRICNQLNLNKNTHGDLKEAYERYNK